MSNFDKWVQDPAAWKPFWRNVGLVPLKDATQTSQQRDLYILNLALMHEDHQAALYQQALKSAANYPQGEFSDEQSRAAHIYLTRYAPIEQAHANFLRATLNYLGGPVVNPHKEGYRSNFGGTLHSLMQFLMGIERMVVGAYRGLAQHLSNLSFVQLMASLYSAETLQQEEIQGLLGHAEPSA